MKELLITAVKPCSFDVADGVPKYGVGLIKTDALCDGEPGVSGVLQECAGDNGCIDPTGERLRAERCSRDTSK